MNHQWSRWTWLLVLSWPQRLTISISKNCEVKKSKNVLEQQSATWRRKSKTRQIIEDENAGFWSCVVKLIQGNSCQGNSIQRNCCGQSTNLRKTKEILWFFGVFKKKARKKDDEFVCMFVLCQQIEIKIKIKIVRVQKGISSKYKSNSGKSSQNLSNN